ncbi:ATP dependent helicase, Lhr family [Plantibacter sp. VKM Ac-1784]|uniref:ATP dependent helicase, Lhr family n=2 Tax=Plantibacter elymi (nom. nud.) TaxID=199708 RepID=A0ABY1REV7_9MICO|nr:ATP dependent helicase, Lhr family [Plantibacter sp. VKM Ac-1784]
MMEPMTEVLERFSPATRDWFEGAFVAPTPAQAGAWDAISRGANALVVAPTGSGKTLSAFLWSIDRLLSEAIAEHAVRPRAGVPLTGLEADEAEAAAAQRERSRGTRVLYISPLKALGVDVERNLRTPLVGIAQAARRLGTEPPTISVGVRSGDTPSADRRAMAKEPPDILITTPESLFLMLTSAARETLRTVDTVIIDEIHAVASTKRGAHLAVSLERLDAMLEKPVQRIGLSATVRPAEEVARFLGGRAPVEIVAPPAAKTFDLHVVVPVDDMTDPDAGMRTPGEADDDGSGGGFTGYTPNSDGGGEDRVGSIWPHVEEAIVDRVLAHRSTIVFANSRRLAERLTARLNEINEARLGDTTLTTPGAGRPPAQLMAQSGQTRGSTSVAAAAARPATEESDDDIPLLARAHHGSVSKEQRAGIEEDLKSGRLRCVVATSSLELGIDMGEVDLVIQVESPPSVASGLQRVGRAGHQVGEVSRGVLFPKHRADLISTTVATERMEAGLIEAIEVPSNPLDILAQQTVAAVALDELGVEDWFETVKRSAPFASLPRSAFEATLDLLAGRYPSDAFAELRPRIVWDRDAGVLIGRPGAQRLAVTSGGTIPDRGLFGVFMVGESGAGARVGELDEEMVYESRVGDVFALGATSWRIQEITHDRVLVTPAFGQPGRLPFWKGDGIGRPAELGRAIGAFVRELDTTGTGSTPRLEAAGLDERAISNLVAYVREQREATGVVPNDTTLVVERSRDELGDWRVILHSPYGLRVHAPWALAVGARVQERLGVDGSAVASDDGIIVRLPDTESEPPGAELFVFEPEELDALVTQEVGGSALFASRFRECAARALLLPNYSPQKRSPLWQQRQRSAQLLEVAKQYPTFPIILETLRECLQDVYDLPALDHLARELQSRAIRIVETTTDQPSPYARSLLFGYVGAFMYEGDSPLAERRAAALAVDSTMLGELLGRVELRELLDPGVIEQTALELQRLDPERRLKGVEGVADALRMLGPLTIDEIAARTTFDGVAVSTDGEASRGDDPHAWAPDPARSAAAVAELERSKRVIRVPIAGEERFAAIEDAGRLRDALGTPLPIGVPVAFTEPVADPLGDLLARHARTHGPFTTGQTARRFGLGTAVVQHTLARLADAGRVVKGEFLPAGRQQVGEDDDADRSPTDATEWCDAGVLRKLRIRSLAALRHEVEPVEQQAFARFLPVWQHLGGTLRGVDGVATVIDQLAGAPIPASAWESLILPSRVADYSPAMLDELTATGEVVWSGSGSIPGNDGWVALHLADTAPLTLPLAPTPHTPDALQTELLATLGGGGAYFFRQLAESVGSTDDKLLVDALWELVWAGLVTNDTFSPLRTLVGSGSGNSAHRVQRQTPRSKLYRGRNLQRPSMSTRASQTLGGRWSILPLAEQDATIRAVATGETLLERYGVVTRGSVVAEGVTGGFALAYRVLKQFEENGRCRRGYFVERLGGAQFASSGTVDRLRGFIRTDDEPPLDAVTLAATDPANPYGAALGWPGQEVTGVKHRPGRKAGALVVLVDGAPVYYLERGGKTALVFSEDDDQLRAGARSLAATVRAGRIEKLGIEQVNGAFVLGTPTGYALRDAGFVETPRGLRLRRG